MILIQFCELTLQDIFFFISNMEVVLFLPWIFLAVAPDLH